MLKLCSFFQKVNPKFKPAIVWRTLASTPPQQTGAILQNRIQELLNKSFPGAQEILVKDISGGCGSMFEVFVASKQFQGMPKVKQHLSVSNILKEEIKDMHGIRIFTEVPEQQQ